MRTSVRRVRHRLTAFLVAGSVATVLGASQAESQVRCGTRWLAEERAARQMAPTMAARRAAVASLAQDPTPIEVGTELRFPVSGSSSLLAATCRRVGTRSFVFVENRQWDTAGGSVLQSHVDALGSLFDEATPADPSRGVHDLIVDAFGAAPDVDGYEQVFLLVLDIGNADVVGFFDSTVAEHLVPELRRDVLYLSQSHLRRQAYLARGTLAHEFQHLVHWGADPDEEIWLDEGLSGYAEEVAGFPEADADAVPEFLRRPDTSLTDWNFNSPARSYGATYLFASYLAERYGPDLIRAVVAETRNGVAGVDRALAQAGSPDRFVDAWAGWIAGNYASSDAALRYAATAGRRVTTFSYETLPLEGLTGNVTGAWGTLNLLFRTPGSLAIDFDGDDGTGFRLWTYAMSGGAGQLAELALSGDNRGHAQAAPIDSLLLIVGRTSPQGGDFELSVRASTPTAVTGPLAAGPDGPTLVSPYPNPFNAQVRIPYVLDEAASVEVTVHALNGQRVRGLVEADRHPGRHEALWDGRDDDGAAVASGAYLVRLRAASSVDLTRVALVR